jgi:hypothetical protein
LHGAFKLNPTTKCTGIFCSSKTIAVPRWYNLQTESSAHATGGKPMKTYTKTIRFLIVIIGMSLISAACTPPARPQVDNEQDKETPTETISPTETLTPTTTLIPPTPTFPAPEGADLPDSAVRSVNERGRDVILDQPGGEVLWTLVETDSGERTWQENLSLEAQMAQDIVTAPSPEAKRQAAVKFAEYLNENVAGDRVVAEFSHEITGDIEVGWDPATEEWVEVTSENRERLDLTGETFPELFAAGWTDEQGRDVFVDQEGQEVVLEKKTWPGVGEVSLAELILMGRKHELQVAGQTGLSLEEYTYLLMVNAKSEDGERYDNRLSDLENYEGEVFALPAVLEQGYFKSFDPTIGWENQQYSQAFELDSSRVKFPQAPSNVVLWPMVKEVNGEEQIMSWIRLIQGVDDLTVLNQFEVHGDTIAVHRLMRETKHDTLGGKNDLNDHPLIIFYQPSSTYGSFTIRITHKLLEDNLGIVGEKGLSASIEVDRLQAVLDYLKNLSPRLATFRPEFWLVNR